MIAMFLALITVVIGMLPLLLSQKVKVGGVIGTVGFFITWLLFYNTMPSLVWPLWGWVGAMVVLFWLIGLLADRVANDGYYTRGHDGISPLTGITGIGGLLLILGYTFFSTWGGFHDTKYAGLIGTVEKREWTQDVQPKDPRHVRLVPEELAFYLATKQLGEAPGAIGSQFQVSREHLTLQMIKGELWYVAPLDFKSFSVWQTARTAPGYVMIHGEDPKRQVIVKTGEKFAYMPSAFFGKNLERHIWSDHLSTGFTDYSFEIDDEKGEAWWVVTTFKPTIGYEGEVVTGVIVVNPTTGEQTVYSKDKIPSFIERVVPREYVERYIDLAGKYVHGWFNSWWGHQDLTSGERPALAYGSDGNPYWVSDVTSVNENDKSLVGLMYVNTRTGKSTLYHAIGGTDRAVLELVNNKVAFRKLHGSDPVIYNVYGRMTSIVPLLGENHSPQGVAFVDVADMQIAVGDDIESAIRQYQRIVSTSGQQVTPERERQTQDMVGVVDRFTPEVRGGETTYYFHILGFPHILSGSGDISPKLRLTQVGNKVKIRFIDSGEDIIPLTSFDNEDLPLKATSAQTEMRGRVAERQSVVALEQNTKTVRGEIGNMSEKELQELIKLKQQQKKP